VLAEVVVALEAQAEQPVVQQVQPQVVEAQVVAAAVVAEPLSSPGLDRIQQLPLLGSRSQCASKDCKMRCWCRSDRYAPRC
jgi:hypothetical protein